MYVYISVVDIGISKSDKVEGNCPFQSQTKSIKKKQEKNLKITIFAAAF